MSIEQFVTPVLRAGIFDRVTVFTQDMIPAFPYARSMKLEVKRTSKLPEHPIEDGSPVTDHRIALPDEITLYVVLQSGTYQIAYPQIIQLWESATFLIVQSWAGTFDSMVIQDCPHTESPDVFDTLPMELKLRQIKTVTATYEPAPANPENKSTKNKGTVNPTPAPANSADGSALQKIGNIQV